MNSVAQIKQFKLIFMRQTSTKKFVKMIYIIDF